MIVGLGELLWDMFPSGTRLGGAPANFAYMASVLGGSSAVVSCVGNDDLGVAARCDLQQHGLDIRHIQVDPEHSTGSVKVSLSPEGSPRYYIREEVAWDYISWTPELAELAASTDAVCFGTLAQRSAVTRHSIHKFLDQTPPHCLKILDVNSRPPFCNAELVRESFLRANVLKLSSEELALVLDAASLCVTDEEGAAVALQQRYGFRAVCITRGAHGSVIAVEGSAETSDGCKVEVADTVGAGDAFTAATALCLLHGMTVSETSEAANAVAAWVASKPGAMPVPDPSEREWLRSIVL